MEYIIHTFGQLVLVFVLANLVLLLVPRSIRKMFQATFKGILFVLRIAINLAKGLVKTMCANAKEIEPKAEKQPLKSNNKKATSTTKQTPKPTTKTNQGKRKSNVKGKVIQFPNVETK